MPPKVYSVDEWQRMRPLIENLYHDDKKLSRDELIDELGKYGFHVTVHQLKARISKWNLNRRITREEYISILRKQEVRTSEGKKTIFIMRGERIEETKLKRAKQRFTSDLGSNIEISTPPELDCLTPDSTAESDEEQSFPIQHVDNTEARHDSVTAESAVNVTLSGVALADLPRENALDNLESTRSVIGTASLPNFNAKYYFAVVEPDEESEMWRLFPDLHLLKDVSSASPEQVDEPTHTQEFGLTIAQREEFNHVLGLTSVFHDLYLDMDRDSQVAACLDMWLFAIKRYNECQWPMVQELQTQVVEWLPKLIPPNHQWLVSSVGLLASSYGEQGRFSEAEGYHVDQVRRSLTIFGPEHITTFASKHHLSLLYMHTGRLPEALTFARAAHDGQMATLGEGHLDTIFSLMTLGGIALRSKKYSTAKQALRKAARDFTRQLGENHIFTYRAWIELAAVFTGAGYPEASKKVYERVLGKMQDKLQPGHHDMMLARMELERLHLRLFEFSAARSQLLIVTETWSEQYGDGSAVTQEALLDLVTAYEGLSQDDLALQIQRRVFEANADQVVKRVHLLTRYREAAQRFWNVGQFQDAIRVQRLVVRVAQSMSAPYAEDEAYLEELEGRRLHMDLAHGFDN